MKIYQHDAGNMTKVAATPIYDKNPSKIFFSGIGKSENSGFSEAIAASDL